MTTQDTTTTMTRDQRKGETLVRQLKAHIAQVVEKFAGENDGQGLGSVGIEREAGLGLNLDRFNNYLTYSLLQSMLQEGEIGAVDETGHRRSYVPATAVRRRSTGRSTRRAVA